MIVEVCANSAQSAVNAQKAGADRIELCSELGVGGVTPSMGLIKKVLGAVSIPVHVLIRPRSAHFTYTDVEFEVMLADVDLCKQVGVQGIVSGVLQSDCTLDEIRTRQLVERADPLHVTFHRAFDWVPDPLETFTELERMGVSTILTSGQASQAQEGLELLRALQQKSQKCTVMAGGGIHPGNVAVFKKIGLSAIHLSATEFGQQLDVSGKIPMNSPQHLNEDRVAQTMTEKVAQVVAMAKTG